MTFLRPSGPGPSLPIEIELALAPFLSIRAMSYAGMAGGLAERFGAAAPSPTEIASFFGWRYAGHRLLNQLGRDRELAAWLFRKAADVTITDLHARAVAEFGRWRVPGRSTIHRFLAARPDWRGTGPRAARGLADARILDLIQREGTGRTLDQLVALCCDRLGPDGAPSRTRLARLLQQQGFATAGRIHRAAKDREVAAFIRWASGCMTLPRLHAEGRALFGARMPSRSATARYIVALRGKRGRRARIEWDRELADFIADRAGRLRPAEILREIQASFTRERWPSRSALFRYVPTVVAKVLKDARR